MGGRRGELSFECMSSYVVHVATYFLLNTFISAAPPPSLHRLSSHCFCVGRRLSRYEAIRAVVVIIILVGRMSNKTGTGSLQVWSSLGVNTSRVGAKSTETVYW